MKRKRLRLGVSRETVRRLACAELAQARGGDVAKGGGSAFSCNCIATYDVSCRCVPTQDMCGDGGGCTCGCV